MQNLATMVRLSWITLASGLASAVSTLNWTATPFNPSSIPLAVRTPYLSTWLPQGAGVALNGEWPTFWANSVGLDYPPDGLSAHALVQVTAWTGYVRVDGVAYTFLGAPNVASAQAAVQKNFSFTSTQSIFNLTAGGIDLTANFLSLIETGDLVKQSTPFAYLSLVVTPNDGKSHSVQVIQSWSG
jgi:hypothetical protein